MTYIMVAIILSTWLALIGASSVLNKRACLYIVAIPTVLLFVIGFCTAVIDTHIGFKADTWRFEFFDFYIFLFKKNWALSTFVICGALVAYELSKLWARHYKVTKPEPQLTTIEYIQNLPKI